MNLKTSDLLCILIGFIILLFGGCTRQPETSWINPSAAGHSRHVKKPEF